MKRILLLLGLVLGAYVLQAQNLRLNGYALYVFDDKIDNYYSSTSYFNATVKGGLQWGGGLEFMVQDYYGIELLYIRQDTKAPVTYYDTRDKSGEFDIAANYILLGFNRYQKFNTDKVEGYGGFMLGAGIFDVENPNSGESGSATKFAWGLRLGVNIYASERIGIKLQTSILSSAQSVGGSLYFGTGGGGAGVSTYSSMLQFGLGGGLVFPLGGLSAKGK